MSAENFADCCNPGGVWEGTPTGEEHDFAGLTSYIAKPPTGGNGKAIVLITDIHSYKFKNLQLLADKLASNGFLVIAPDFFHGDQFPMDFNAEGVQAWFGRNGLPNDRTKAELKAVISHLREAHDIKHVGCQGFCWGGWWAVWLAGQQQDPQVDAAVVAHGSKMTPELLGEVRKPALFLQPEHDQQMNPELLEHVNKAAKQAPGSDVVHFPAQHHGFTVRPDPSHEGVDEASEKALKLTIAFFKEHLR